MRILEIEKYQKPINDIVENLIKNVEYIDVLNGHYFHLKNSTVRKLDNDFYYYNDDIDFLLFKLHRHINIMETYKGELDDLHWKTTKRFMIELKNRLLKKYKK